MILKQIKDSKKLGRYVEDEHGIHIVANAETLEASIVLLNAVRKLRDEVDSHLKEKPQKNDLDIREDLKYTLGQISALDWILALPSSAMRVLQTQPDDPK